MATIRAYTTIEQSRKLATILPLESADMRIGNYVGKSGKVDGTNIHYYPKNESFGAPEIIYAWSLAALLSVIPEGVVEHYYAPNIQKENGKYTISYGDEELLCVADNSVDACYEMILKLNELNLL